MSTITELYWIYMLLFKIRNCWNVIPQQLYHCVFPPTMYEWSRFSTSLPAFEVSLSSHSDRCTGVLHWASLFISLMANDVDHLFVCLFPLFTCICSLAKHLFMSFAYILVGFFGWKFERSLYILDTSPFVGCMVYKYFTWINKAFCRTKVFWWGWIYQHFLLCIIFLGSCLRTLLEIWFLKNFLS